MPSKSHSAFLLIRKKRLLSWGIQTGEDWTKISKLWCRADLSKVGDVSLTKEIRKMSGRKQEAIFRLFK